MDNTYLNVLKFAEEILQIPSPSGYTSNAVKYIKNLCDKEGFACEILNNGNLMITIPGQQNTKTIGVTAHLDTLGAMVSAINSNGTLKFSVIGGPILPTYDGEYATIITREGKVYNGTFLSDAPAIHVFNNATTLPRDPNNMHIRLDELVYTKEGVKKLGIENGDFIALDPKTTITDTGFIKSRFLDDKLSVAIIFELIRNFKKENIKPIYNTTIVFSTYEEVGFGASYMPNIDEMLAVDMGCVGLHLEGNEEKVSICAKDSAGPYNYEFTTKLIDLCKVNSLNYAIDIFPSYSSDVSAALKAGNNIKGALIGSGVAASHGMERAHINGVKNTYELLKAYLLSK